MRIQSAQALEGAMRLCAHYCTNLACTVGAHSLPAIHAKPSANKPYICEQFKAVYPKLLYLAIFMQYAQLTWRGAASRAGSRAQESTSFATSTFSPPFPFSPRKTTQGAASRTPVLVEGVPFSPRKTAQGVCAAGALSVERALRAAKTARRPTPGGCQLPSQLLPCRSSRP